MKLLKKIKKVSEKKGKENAGVRLSSEATEFLNRKENELLDAAFRSFQNNWGLREG